ncbi:MAG: phospho-sugar mutase [Clostridia bacterium]|nr:phospho-sugar mutase [Clostridia bacterium]
MEFMKEYEGWLASDALLEKDKKELESIREDRKEIEERFYTELEFGTAGLRGIIRVGTNGMNGYVIRRATQGLSDYMNALPGAAERGVCIAYDSRHFSDVFAREAACVLAANGIRVRLFSTLHAVPQLSYAIRHQSCIAGIVITASHNPAKYNGYKVYWEHGGQVTPEQASDIYACIQKVPFFSEKTCDYEKAVATGKIGLIGREEDEAYYEVTKSVLLRPELVREKGKDLSIVYTPLHGTGSIPVQEILKQIGVTNVSVVPEQEKPDGAFPTVTAPNPENPDAFKLAFALAEEKGATVILATDPDADRLGIAVKTTEGKWMLLTGNQIGSLLLEHIISERSKTGTLPKNAVAVKSIVSTQLARVIAERNGVEMEDVLTGFRFISEKIDEYEKSGEKTFLFGFEESYGFLAGGFSRDKDAICSSMLAAEMCVCCAEKGMTLYDALRQLYADYGYFKESVASYTLEGKAGIEKIAECMRAMKEKPWKDVAGYGVSAVEDYASGICTFDDGSETCLMLPRSNMIRYLFENGDWIVVRPSGTEPKLKLYVGAGDADEQKLDEKLESMKTDCDGRLRKALGL